MDNSVLHPFSVSKIKLIVFDIVALAAIYLVPAISHLFNFPVYYLEPMRIMLILTIAHTNRNNAYLIALTLPIFSLLISEHPSVIKTTLICAELFLNVWLYFFIFQKISNRMLSMFLSILLSKIFYYLAKILLVNLSLISGDVIATPVYIQIVMLFVFSGYIYLFGFSKHNKN